MLRTIIAACGSNKKCLAVCAVSVSAYVLITGDTSVIVGE